MLLNTPSGFHQNQKHATIVLKPLLQCKIEVNEQLESYRLQFPKLQENKNKPSVCILFSKSEQKVPTSHSLIRCLLKYH